MHLLHITLVFTAMCRWACAAGVILRVILGRADVNPGIVAGTNPGWPHFVIARGRLILPRALLAGWERLNLSYRQPAHDKQEKRDQIPSAHLALFYLVLRC